MDRDQRLFKVKNNKYIYPFATQMQMVDLRTKFFNEAGWYASDNTILKHYGYRD